MLRIGYKMQLACELLAGEGGALPSVHRLALWVGPHGSTKYGYAIVKRCIRAGLVTREPGHPLANPKGDGAVVLTDAGRKCSDEAAVSR